MIIANGVEILHQWFSWTPVFLLSNMIMKRICTICDTRLQRFCELLIISTMFRPQIARLEPPTAQRSSDLNFWCSIVDDRYSILQLQGLFAFPICFNQRLLFSRRSPTALQSFLSLLRSKLYKGRWSPLRPATRATIT